MVAVSQNMKSDTILFTITLQIMLIIVMVAFMRVIPDMVDYCSKELGWLFP